MVAWLQKSCGAWDLWVGESSLGMETKALHVEGSGLLCNPPQDPWRPLGIGQVWEQAPQSFP